MLKKTLIAGFATVSMFAATQTAHATYTGGYQVASAIAPFFAQCGSWNSEYLASRFRSRHGLNMIFYQGQWKVGLGPFRYRYLAEQAAHSCPGGSYVRRLY